MILFSLLTWWLLVQKKEKERDFLYKKEKKRKCHFKQPSWQSLVGHNIQNRLCLPRKPFLRFSCNFCFWGAHKEKYRTKPSRPSWRWQRILCLSLQSKSNFPLVLLWLNSRFTPPSLRTYTHNFLLYIYFFFFHRPYRYFSIALKVFFFCPIAIKFSPVIGYVLKFVKM